MTLVLVNLTSIMQRADESLLPGAYKKVGASLHTDPTRLGSLTLFRSIVQSSYYPLATYLATHHNRAHVIALGAYLSMGCRHFSRWLLHVAISRGLNGIGIVIVIPAIQSLVADSTDDNNQYGTTFGWLQLTGNLGSIIGGLFSILIASTSVIGIDSWRIAFHLVGLISVIVGILVRLFANDPHYIENNGRTKDEMPCTFSEEVKNLIKESKSVIRIPTFQILIAQAVFGSFLWSETEVLWTIFIIGASLGSLFGGKMGDVLAKLTQSEVTWVYKQ
ncbi:putative major facilitator superfamily [Rosa chinensis]|uniref:Putative major facilitator superfamily n=1 Tax=Rosa chinensis TaxID=74649 RepID=A0A2P6RQV4_ROSCH|nr:putative major facilitator superfamily [Rosa chinensis]